MRQDPLFKILYILLFFTLFNACYVPGEVRRYSISNFDDISLAEIITLGKGTVMLKEFSFNNRFSFYKRHGIPYTLKFVAPRHFTHLVSSREGIKEIYLRGDIKLQFFLHSGHSFSIPTSSIESLRSIISDIQFNLFGVRKLVTQVQLNTPTGIISYANLYYSDGVLFLNSNTYDFPSIYFSKYEVNRLSVMLTRSHYSYPWHDISIGLY
ncbi:hypothetical protein DB313_00010 [Borrelia turcica IST7]|uniref:Uncharacterized protein n=1 Tax=Borrelia turcica IST7 TaxID=1104446 RepID=A0A386PIH3_9SPIR|nr:hypothetical protein [Borrelia turcica]AYE35904.1 hypothetical protein DB313_00010 [Borrelia turcica IST7]